MKHVVRAINELIPDRYLILVKLHRLISSFYAINIPNFILFLQSLFNKYLALILKTSTHAQVNYIDPIS